MNRACTACLPAQHQCSACMERGSCRCAPTPFTPTPTLRHIKDSHAVVVAGCPRLSAGAAMPCGTRTLWPALGAGTKPGHPECASMGSEVQMAGCPTLLGLRRRGVRACLLPPLAYWGARLRAVDNAAGLASALASCRRRSGGRSRRGSTALFLGSHCSDCLQATWSLLSRSEQRAAIGCSGTCAAACATALPFVTHRRRVGAARPPAGVC